MDLAAMVRAFCHPTPKPLVYVEPTALMAVQW